MNLNGRLLERVAKKWIDFLCETGVPFVIRIRSELTIALSDGSIWSFRTLLRGRRIRTVTRCWQGSFANAPTPQTLYFAARQIKSGETLIIVTNKPDANRARCDYKKRWGIECLFADAKSRGFTLEDTHLTQHRKISTFMALVAIAMRWAYALCLRSHGVQSH